MARIDIHAGELIGDRTHFHLKGGGPSSARDMEKWEYGRPE
jgi:hypothetical protein